MFKTILIGGDMAKRAAKRIGEFDFLCGLPFSVVGFVNPNSQENFSLVNCGPKWHDLPVYKNLPNIPNTPNFPNSVGIYFNAKHVLYWVQEVVNSPAGESVKNIVIFAEDVPERDEREIVVLAAKHKVNIVGPSSTGMLIPGEGRLGEIGGDWFNLQKCQLDKSGTVGIITKSGTMSGEMLWVVSQNSDGIAQAVHIGGDSFPATDFVYWLEEYSKNPKIKTVVISGEAGGDLEERAAQWYTKNKKFKLVVVISGLFLEQMPKGQKFGHAGAKQEESGFGSAKNKIQAFKDAGAIVVEFEQLDETLRNL